MFIGIPELLSAVVIILPKLLFTAAIILIVTCVFIYLQRSKRSNSSKSSSSSLEVKREQSNPSHHLTRPNREISRPDNNQFGQHSSFLESSDSAEEIQRADHELQRALPCHSNSAEAVHCSHYNSAQENREMSQCIAASTTSLERIQKVFILYVQPKIAKTLPEYYHGMIQNLVPLFQKQRKKGNQFAVLFLASQQDKPVMIFYTRKGAVSSPDRLTDNTYPTYPCSGDLCNYITARPGENGKESHAEAQLMNRFNELVISYQFSDMPVIQSIVLYTWLLPCDYCKSRIINTLKPITLGRTELSAFVFYTQTNGVADWKEKCTTRDLNSAGIIAPRVAYDVFIPRALN